MTLRNELKQLDTVALPLKLELAYARVESHVADFEAAMIEDAKGTGTHYDGNSSAGSWVGGSGWVYGWSIVGERVKWGPAKPK